jgi:hypothetical protein
LNEETRTGSRWWYLLLAVPVVALLFNFAIAIGLTLALRAAGAADDSDDTHPRDYDELVETGRPAPVGDAPTG